MCRPSCSTLQRRLSALAGDPTTASSKQYGACSRGTTSMAFPRSTATSRRRPSHDEAVSCTWPKDKALNAMSQSFAGTNVLVIGGAGFVGSNLVTKILQHGPRKLTIVDNFLSADPVNV